MREYHCTTCDFHITGPADDVADEIEAHEEQHHADAATKVEITPEILRAVSGWIDGCGHGLQPGHALREEADRLERQRADEQRIDELAQEFLRAEKEIAIYGLVDWGNQSENQRDAYRAGIRAVLAAYDPEQRLTAPKPYDKGGHTVQPLRQWGDLKDIPSDVTTVHNSAGEEIYRSSDAEYGWRWMETDGPLYYSSLAAYAPYTEIPGGDR